VACWFYDCPNVASLKERNNSLLDGREGILIEDFLFDDGELNGN
jgi:hypothetical protein